MQRRVLLVLLMAASYSASAEWTRMGDSGELTYYVDTGSVVRFDGVARLSTLRDYRTPRTTPRGWIYRSEKIQAEFDCQRERWRPLYTSFHSGPMGGGPVFGDNYSHGWMAVGSDTVAANAWQFACAKK
jgi:hypothetical protein